MAALSDYIDSTRTFLRDYLSGGSVSSQFFTDAQVIKWVNQGRADVVRDSNCCREVALLPLSMGVERYSRSGMVTALLNQGTSASAIYGVIGCVLEWTPSLKFALDRLAYAQFSAYYRAIPTFQSFPIKYCEYAQNIYVAPVPNQSYTLEVDTLYLPTKLVATTDQETSLYDPWIDLVPIKAAKWLKWFQQSFQESDQIEKIYQQEFYAKQQSAPAFSVPSEYDNIDTL